MKHSDYEQAEAYLHDANHLHNLISEAVRKGEEKAEAELVKLDAKVQEQNKKLVEAQSKLSEIEAQDDKAKKEAKDKLAESIRQFDEKMKLEWAKHKETQSKNSRDAELKQKQINKQRTTVTK